MKKIKKQTKRVLIAWLSLLLVICVILGYTYYSMQPVIIRYAESIAETIMLNSANEAVENILQRDGFDYNQIAVLSKNTDGEIISLEIDTYKINYFKSGISNEISNLISNRERYIVPIPLGTFFNNSYTNGFGPDINFKMQMTTTAFVDFEHEFRSAGINQVLHRVVINVKINGSFVIAGYKRSISVNTSVIAAQTVIMGKVPQNFTNVIEEESDNTAGLINDYGAVGE